MSEQIRRKLEPVSMVVADELARLSVRDTSIKLIVCFVGAVASTSLLGWWGAPFAVFVFVPFIGFSFVERYRARRAQRWLRRPDATPALDGNTLVITSAGGWTALPLWSRGQIQLARQRAIPTASTPE